MIWDSSIGSVTRRLEYHKLRQHAIRTEGVERPPRASDPSQRALEQEFSHEQCCGAVIKAFAVPDVDKAHIQRILSSAQVAWHSIGLLFDAAARIQVGFAFYPYCVLVYFGPRQDITSGQTRNGSVTAEL